MAWDKLIARFSSAGVPSQTLSECYSLSLLTRLCTSSFEDFEVERKNTIATAPTAAVELDTIIKKSTKILKILDSLLFLCPSIFCISLTPMIRAVVSIGK